MKARTKLLCRVAAATCSALILASAVAGVSYADNNVKLIASASSTVTIAQDTKSWSGYVAKNHTFNTVQAEITVPTVVCTTKNSNILIWVGFDGFNETNPTVEQVGVGADCGAVGSKPIYFTWWEMYPTYNIQRIPKSIVDIKPGDKIWATATYNGSPKNNYTLRVRNVRTNQAKNTIVKCGAGTVCKRGSAEWIVERKYINRTDFAPLAKWYSDPWMFMGAKAAVGVSRTLNPMGTYGPTPIDMVAYDTTNHKLATVSSITHIGTVFTSTYHNAR